MDIVFGAVRVPVSVSFTAMHERKSYFRVKCHIPKKQNPLCLIVKGEGYHVKSTLIFEDKGGFKAEFSSLSTNTIDFGNVRSCGPCGLA